MTRAKVCCISSVREAALAVEAGAAAIGLVSEMPSGPGVIPDERIREIAATVPPGVATFLLTSSTSADAIIAQQRHAGVSTLQLVDEQDVRTYGALRLALPGIRIVQVVHVTGGEAIDAALEIAPHVDALLLDSGQPDAPIRELGGTGRVHDWSVSAEIRRRVPVPVFLAGGLRPDNVSEAIRSVRPFAVDVCSGLRTHGRLDARKLATFMSEVVAASRLR